MQKIFERGVANGVNCQIIDRHRLRELEPHAAGVAAILVPEAGIVNYGQVCQRLLQHVLQRDGQFVSGARVTAIDPGAEEVIVHTTAGSHRASYVVNCAGLHCDRVARLSGSTPPAKIVPFRGEYYKLKPDFQYLCRNLIYPVPDPSFPFLGVHFTRMIDGSVECGPNAVLAFAREGYRRRDVNLRDLVETLTYSGFLRLARRYWRTGLAEMWRSVSKPAFVKALQRLLPEIRSEHLQPAPSGVRAQAVAPDGSMVDDFLIIPQDRVVHVNNAPSPAATSSLNIGKLICDQLDSRLG
jgi:L-2-hydroxyglutarate oxidase